MEESLTLNKEIERVGFGKRLGSSLAIYGLVIPCLNGYLPIYTWSF